MAEKTKTEKVADIAAEEAAAVKEPEKEHTKTENKTGISLEDEVKGLKAGMSEVLEYIKSQKDTATSAQKAPEAAAAVAKEDERTEYVFPIDERDTGDLIIGVNGKIIRVKRGVPVKVTNSAIRCYLDSQEQKRLLYLQQKDLENKNLSD